MSEEDIALIVKNINRIEKKVDLLYKILLELYIGDVGHPYNQEYINNFMDELIPLFGLSAVEVDLDIPSIQKETMQELKNKLETELSRLKKIYESGNFLAKEENTIKDKISDITSYLETWDWDKDESGVVEGLIWWKEDIINKSKRVYEESLFLDLRKKLGVSYSYRPSYLSSPSINDLIEEINIEKKNFKDFIEKIQSLGKNK